MYIPFGYTAYAPSLPSVTTNSGNMDPISLGIGAGFSLLNGLFGGWSQSQNNKRQIEFAREAMQQEMAFTREMFDRTNEYNLPVNQMKRLQDAQINPAQAWSSGLSADTGNGQGSENVSPVTPNTQPIPSPFVGMTGENVFSFMREQLELKKKAAEVAKTWSEREKLYKEIDVLDYEAKNAEIRNQLSQIELQYSAKIKEANLAESWQRVNNLMEDAALKVKEGAIMDAEKLLKEALTETEHWKVKEIKALLEPRVKELLASAEAKRASARESNANAAMQEMLKPKLAKLNDKQIEQARETLKQAKIETLSDLEDYMRKLFNVDSNDLKVNLQRQGLDIAKGSDIQKYREDLLKELTGWNDN